MRSMLLLLPLLLSTAVGARVDEAVAAGGPDARGVSASSPRTGEVAAETLALSSYRSPVPLPMRVVRTFQPPLQKYGAGHLGIDLAAAAGSPVLAAGAGTVRFAGSVAGHGVVVIAHPDGISTEYEPVRSVVRTGQLVVAGQRIGVVLGTHRGCPIDSCLHWGARSRADYLDPLSLLQPAGVVRLLPWNYNGPLG